jgi:hypothetical protein
MRWDGGKSPALLTRRSSPPKRRTQEATAASTAPPSRTSQTRPRASGPRKASATSGAMSRTQVAAPCPRSASAIARPMPLAPPATSAMRPAKGGAPAPPLSFRCSSSQYSTSNSSASPRRRAEAHEPPPLPDRPARRRVEGRPGAVVVAREVGALGSCVALEGGVGVVVDHGRRPLGADHVVRRHRAAHRQVGHVGARGEADGRLASVVPGHEGAPRGARGRAPQLGERHRIRDVGRRRPDGRVPRPRLPQRALRAVDEADHPLVALPGVVGEGEDAVVKEHHPLEGREVRAAGPLPDLAGEDEARHHVGDHEHAPAVELLDALLAARRVGEGDDRVGMGVVHEAQGDQRMQDRLDGRIGGRGIEERGALLAHHVSVGERVALRHAQQGGEPHRREAARLDRGEIPAASLDVEDVGLVAVEVVDPELHGGVAASVQHEGGIAPQQARCVGTELEEILGGLGRAEQALHRHLVRETSLASAQPRGRRAAPSVQRSIARGSSRGLFRHAGHPSRALG